MSIAPSNVAIALPFGIDDSGAVAVEQVPIRQLSDRVTALAATQPGQRVMATRFGVDSANLLFSLGDELASQQISLSLASAMKIYEPGAVLKSVSLVADSAGTGIASIQAVAAPATVQVGAPASVTVTVRADGTVITSP